VVDGDPSDLACAIVAQRKSPHSAHIALEHDMETCPSWCPLRGGSISVSAEPYALQEPGNG
jgi:hypothetical protein